MSSESDGEKRVKKAQPNLPLPKPAVTSPTSKKSRAKVRSSLPPPPLPPPPPKPLKNDSSLEGIADELGIKPVAAFLFYKIELGTYQGLTETIRRVKNQQPHNQKNFQGEKRIFKKLLYLGQMLLTLNTFTGEKNKLLL